MEKTLVWRSRSSPDRHSRIERTVQLACDWKAKSSQWFLANLTASEARLAGPCNDSLGEFIKSTLNTVTLLKFTGHWAAMGLLWHERQTNVFPKSMSQKLTDRVLHSRNLKQWLIVQECIDYMRFLVRPRQLYCPVRCPSTMALL